MGDGGDYGFEMVGPSPDLEAIWGPNAPSASRVDRDDDAPEPVASSLIVPDPVLAPPARRRKPAFAVGAAIVVMVAMVVGAFAVAGTGDDGRDQSVTAAGAPSDDELVVDEESAANAQAFLERWQAGPSTTLSLGAAGVPLSERPTTTTSTTTTIARRPVGGSNSGTDTDEAYNDEAYTDESYTRTPRRATAPTTTTTERPPTLRSDDPRLPDAERVARDFVDAMMRRDCEAFWSAFSANTIAFFEEMAEEGESAKDELCASLAEEELPVVTVRPPARPYRDGAVVDMVAEGEPETEPLYLVLEAEQWKVDLLGGMYEE